MAAIDRERSRRANFEQIRPTLPLPAVIDDVTLPDGRRLAEDEFVVRIAKDWKTSVTPLILTTTRLICPRDPSTRDPVVIPLTEIRDVRVRKNWIGYQSIIVETAEEKFSFPAHINGARIRADITLMVEAARGPAAAASGTDRYERLRQLGDLKSSGVLTESEFEAEKARILNER